MAGEPTQQRRLAAILAADVVGYSRLMEADEAGTLAALKERRKGILQPLVAEHHGRIIKVMGDGVLVEFASAVNAVACAVELQKRMAAANDGVLEQQRIMLRATIALMTAPHIAIKRRSAGHPVRFALARHLDRLRLL